MHLGKVVQHVGTSPFTRKKTNTKDPDGQPIFADWGASRKVNIAKKKRNWTELLFSVSMSSAGGHSWHFYSWVGGRLHQFPVPPKTVSPPSLGGNCAQLGTLAANPTPDCGQHAGLPETNQPSKQRTLAKSRGWRRSRNLRNSHLDWTSSEVMTYCFWMLLESVNYAHLVPRKLFDRRAPTCSQLAPRSGAGEQPNKTIWSFDPSFLMPISRLMNRTIVRAQWWLACFVCFGRHVKLILCNSCPPLLGPTVA